MTCRRTSSSSVTATHHAIITNERLAAVFETHMDRDAELTAAAGAMEPFALPDLFVTESAPVEIVQFDEPPRFFPPLRLRASSKGSAALDTGQLCRAHAGVDPFSD